MKLQVQDAEHSLRIERTIVNLRWIAVVIIVGQVVYLEKASVSSFWHSAPAAFLILYNSFFFVLAYHVRMTPRRLLAVAALSTVLDLIVISIFVADTGFLPDTYLGFVFVIIAAALRLELIGSIATGVLVTGSYWAITLFTSPNFVQPELEPVLGRSLFFLALSVGMGFLTRRLRLEREARDTMGKIAQQKASELEAVIDSIADGVAIVDTSGRIAAVNEAGRRLLGWELPDPLGASPAGMQFPARDLTGQLMEPEDVPPVRALKGETIKDGELTVKGPSGKLNYLSVSAAPVLDVEGRITGSVTVFHDVTSFKQSQLAKDDLISQASHELRTPITSLKGYAQMMLRKLPETPERAYERRGLKVIHSQADRLTDLVNELLDVSKAQTDRLELQTECFDLVGLLKDIIERLAVALEHHQLTMRSKGCVSVNADRSRVEQVFTNLISNAVKFSPHGGEIEVQVELDREEAVVMVKDHGIGIPKNKQDRIFEQGYQAHIGSPVAHGGMGLGLYISSDIIARHGGRMWVHSEEGQGSSFYFSLPIDHCQVAEG
ncbi:MAG: ATP-binding protein [Chloroflexi bacterium]|nr:ATP-binding protein [Chloroflexota bacterium]